MLSYAYIYIYKGEIISNDNERLTKDKDLDKEQDYGTSATEII